MANKSLSGRNRLGIINFLLFILLTYSFVGTSTLSNLVPKNSSETKTS